MPIRYRQPTLITERPHLEGDEWSADGEQKRTEKLERAEEAVQAYLRAGSDRYVAIGYAAADYGFTKSELLNHMYGDV